MDGFTLIAELAKALGWPVAAVVIVVVLQRPIARLLGSLRNLKYGKLKLEFRRRLEKAKKEAAALPAPSEPSAPPRADETPLVQRHLLAQADFRGAILLAWQRVEEQLVELAESVGVKRGWPLKPTDELARYLQYTETITDEIASLLGDLQHLRNDLLHNPTFVPTQAQAEEYVALAERVVRFLRERTPRKAG